MNVLSVFNIFQPKVRLPIPTWQELEAGNWTATITTRESFTELTGFLDYPYARDSLDQIFETSGQAARTAASEFEKIESRLARSMSLPSLLLLVR